MLEARTTITAGGRIVIPSDIRKKLNLSIGEEVVIKVEFGEIHIASLKQSIKNAQALIRKYNKKRVSLKDSLLKQRKEDLENEE